MKFVKCRVLRMDGKIMLNKRNGALFLLAKSVHGKGSYNKDVKEVFPFLPENLLSTSIVSEGYPETFRPFGIIFETKEIPIYWAPFNIPTIISVLEELAELYGWEPDIYEDSFEFLCKSLEEFNEKFPRWGSALEKLEKFAIELYEKHHPEEKQTQKKEVIPTIKKGIEEKIFTENLYNEVLFEKDIEIKPKAFFSEDLSTLKLLTKEITDYKEHFLNLPIHKSAIDYFKKKKSILNSTELFNP